MDTPIAPSLAKEEKACKAACVPCDVPPLCRNAFFTGKLLTERDFTLEQRYFIDKLRLHHLALHGWGIACGLGLKPHPHCPSLRIVIEPGLAIDGCGREIWIRDCIEWELPKLETAAPPAEDPCPPDTPPPDDGKPAPEKPGAAPAAYQQNSPYDREPPQRQHDPYDDHPEPCRDGIDLYLSLCYEECESELVPAPFDECACNGLTKRANRICEGYCIQWSTTRPEDWPREEECGCDEDETDDCELIFRRIRQRCHVPSRTRCVPLGVIRGFQPGQDVVESMFDYGDRRDLASTRVLELLIRCILHKLPTKNYTHIDDMNWEHGMEYSCKQFQQMFVGDGKAEEALSVTFNDAVRTETLSTLSFQAIVVQHTRERKEGGYLEVAPAKVWASADRKTFYLRIEPGYAAHCLERGSFDVFVTLRCNALVDDRGLAVDGTLLARGGNDVIVGPPTGDGIPGGTFESWFRVCD
ncbi:MAG TPA: hypothetical protein VKB52_05370 [Rhodanobacteraceae bacterium]|nr:hypothetical protein [Rhodanobacteraceae bacterium]